MLFSPVFFPAAVRVQLGFVFSPGLCVDLGMLRLNLFVNPRYNHYCFGDYYDAAYQRAGIYPWFQCETLHSWYDPLYVYDKWQFGRTDPKWAGRQAQQFKQFQSNRDLRPARTYTELQAQSNRLPAAKRPERPLVQPIRNLCRRAIHAGQVRAHPGHRTPAARRQCHHSRKPPQPARHLGGARPPAGGRPDSRRPRQPAARQPRRPAETLPCATHPGEKRARPRRPRHRAGTRSRKTPVIAPKPSASRYIEKAAPAAPASENSYHPAVGGNTRPSGNNPPAGGNNAPGRNRQK